MIKTNRVEEYVIVVIFLVTNVLKIIGKNEWIIAFSILVFLMLLLDNRFRNSIIINRSVVAFFALMECSNIIGGVFNTSHLSAGILYDFCLFCYAIYGRKNC